MSFMCNKLLLFILSLLVCSAGLADPVGAEIYRYVDERGKVHFTNVPTSSKYIFYRKEGGASRPDGESFRLDHLIAHSADAFRLDKALIKAVIKVESDFNPRVVSRKGAKGLMQLMPETAEEVGVRNPFDPSQAIYGGSWYLRKMLDSFNRNLDYALAAYNAGPNAVRKYGGIPPFEETQNYVRRVKYFFDYYRRNESQF